METLLAAVASVSLLVGGIGIMNIMARLGHGAHARSGSAKLWAQERGMF
jgi:hypothetical protein